MTTPSASASRNEEIKNISQKAEGKSASSTLEQRIDSIAKQMAFERCVAMGRGGSSALLAQIRFTVLSSAEFIKNS